MGVLVVVALVAGGLAGLVLSALATAGVLVVRSRAVRRGRIASPAFWIAAVVALALGLGVATILPYRPVRPGSDAEAVVRNAFSGAFRYALCPGAAMLAAWPFAVASRRRMPVPPPLPRPVSDSGMRTGG